LGIYAPYNQPQGSSRNGWLAMACVALVVAFFYLWLGPPSCRQGGGGAGSTLADGGSAEARSGLFGGGADVVMTSAQYDFHELYGGRAAKVVGDFDNVGQTFTLQYKFNTAEEKQNFCYGPGTARCRVFEVNPEGIIGNVDQGATVSCVDDDKKTITWRVKLSGSGDYFVCPEGSFFTAVSGAGALVRF
jgi:hypothetical protein